MEHLPADPYSTATVQAGVHGWDVVRMPRIWGEHVLAVLGDATGGVIEDDLGHLLYWLIPAGVAAQWQPQAAHGIQVHSHGCWLVVPGMLRPGAPRWRIPDRALTDPALLEAAIRAALGPRPEAGR